MRDDDYVEDDFNVHNDGEYQVDNDDIYNDDVDEKGFCSKGL